MTRPAAFSRKWAQRWVCKRAYELGWDKELFSSFERTCSRGRGEGPSCKCNGARRQEVSMDWLPRVSCSLSRQHATGLIADIVILKIEFIMGRGNYTGVTSIPTNWLRKNGEHQTYHNEQSTWWQPYRFPIDHLEELGGSESLSLGSAKFTRFFSTSDREINLLKIKQWYVVRGFWSQKQGKPEVDKNGSET